MFFLIGFALLLIGVWAQIEKNNIYSHLNKVVGYRDDPDLQVLIDTMQESWHCCGINGADDWDRNTYFSIAAREVASPEAGGVPFSCCLNSSQMAFKNFYCGHGVRLKILGICFAQNLKSDIFAQRAKWYYTH
ncbi:hypothetical protein NECAME_04343 [Necator americanus]|uniref:Tetraspanin family protein n=1 Tax=Necator americanus TaxID=51031 RepID=W2SUP8_NECAM|nr:hypothetical protein NECAME_04343 [Necator americanus]ETN73345.1 hypothetical protein NECAME_04343 [Necator americanus]